MQCRLTYLTVATQHFVYLDAICCSPSFVLLLAPHSLLYDINKELMLCLINRQQTLQKATHPNFSSGPYLNVQNITSRSILKKELSVYTVAGNAIHQHEWKGLACNVRPP